MLLNGFARFMLMMIKSKDFMDCNAVARNDNKGYGLDCHALQSKARNDKKGKAGS